MLQKFSCIRDGGLEIYSREYTQNFNGVDDQLVAGFFYAIQSISEEIKNPVSFIRLQNSLVYLKTYGEFILILMFSAIPEGSIVDKCFEDLAQLFIEYYTNFKQIEFPPLFSEKVDKILSSFTINNILDNSNVKETKRIAILGLAKAGKTSIKRKFFNQYSTNQLKEITPTVGIDISKNLIEYLQESLFVLDFGGQKSYRKNYLLDEKNWKNINTVIYVIDIQDRSSFNDSITYLNNIWEKITGCNQKTPNLSIFMHKFDKDQHEKLRSNVQEILMLFKDYIKGSVFFFTSIDDESSVSAIIKTLFLSLPKLIIKQILESFLVEMFQVKVLNKIKELKLSSKDSQQLFKAGESIGIEISNDFQKKWLDYYLGNYQIKEQQLNTKKIHLSFDSNSLEIEIDNWENNEISADITNPFLTGFLNSIFKSLYISPSIITKTNKISTIWKIDITSDS